MEKKLMKAPKKFRFSEIIPVLGTSETFSRQSILTFFNSKTYTEIKRKASQEIKSYYRNNVKEINEINVYALLIRSFLEVQNKTTHIRFDKTSFYDWILKGEWKNHLDKVEYFKSLPQLIEKFGCYLILLPYLPKSVYGFIVWQEETPIIGLTDKNKDLASCWHSLFHLFYHVLNNPGERYFETSIGTFPSHSFDEYEADEFASDHLFNGLNIKDSLFKDKQERLNLLTSDIHPMMLKYWEKRCKKSYIGNPPVKITFEPQFSVDKPIFKTENTSSEISPQLVIIQKLKSLMNNQNLSMEDLAILTNLSIHKLYRIFNGKSELNVNTLFLIANKLGVKMQVVL